ncbi:ANTAR domain-containing protein [Streptomyces sp. NPDC059009]|uniref:ANTAR domain-containing protein n=1 Tax=Streptomyces sp. NPDC059009 TaxID=3346694 RepID=UPI00367494EC
MPELSYGRHELTSGQPAPDSGAGTAHPAGRDPADVHELRTEVGQLRRAIKSRPAIDLARGILMASFGLSPEEAWAVLVKTSQGTNIKLHHIASDLVGTVQGPPLSELVKQQIAAAVGAVRAIPPENAAPPKGPAVT